MLQTMMMLKDGAGSDDEVEFFFACPRKGMRKILTQITAPLTRCLTRRGPVGGLESHYKGI